MAKITRKTAVLFGINASSTQIEQFGSKEQLGSLVYSIDPDVIQGLPAWSQGWSSAQYLQVFAPYYQDRNAVDLVNLYQAAYCLEMGIPEWDNATPYYIYSVVQYLGQIFISLIDSNINNIPPVGGSNGNWSNIAFPSTGTAISPTTTVLKSGSGTYTPPVGCVRIFVRMVGGGGGGGGQELLSRQEYEGSPLRPGVSGTDTSLGSYLVRGGSGGGSAVEGSGNGTGGAGGSYLGTPDVVITGANGQNGQSGANAYGGGGVSKFGGAGAAYLGSLAALDATDGSGSGGGGFNDSDLCGGGGGSGAYLEVTMQNPTAQGYSIGTGGAGGIYVNNSSLHGGHGGSGIIIINEFYY